MVEDAMGTPAVSGRIALPAGRADAVFLQRRARPCCGDGPSRLERQGAIPGGTVVGVRGVRRWRTPVSRHAGGPSPAVAPRGRHSRYAVRYRPRQTGAHQMHMETPPAPATTADARSSFLEEKAFKSRTVLVFGAITDQTAADTVRRLIALDAASDAPIDMLVSSPGGHLESGDTVHDVVRF